jgi:hypothetical protein
LTYKINVEGGKYTFINDNGIVGILRNGEEWRNESGDKALLCLLQQTESLEVERDYWKEKYLLLQKQ